MNTNDTYTQPAKDDKAIKSNCSILAMLSRPPQGRTPADEVVYSHYDFDKERGIIVEHKVKCVSPLTSTAVRLLAFLIRNLDPDTNEIVITGDKLFTELGRTAELYEAIQALKRIDILNKITDTDTQWSVYHRLGIIESVTFSDGDGCADWDAVRDETSIRLKLYDRFTRVYVQHIIEDLNISLDFVALSQNGVMEDVAEELKDAANAPSTGAPTDITDGAVTDDAVTDGAVTDDAVTDGDDEGFEEGYDEEDEEVDDTDVAVEETSIKQIDDNTLVLVSVRQLHRIFGDEHDADFEIEDGVLYKYHGTGGDIAIPKSVMVICDRAFEDCVGLTSVTIPPSVKLIGKDAFRNCTNLVEVDMPLSMLKLVAPCVEFYFSGTEIAELLKKDSWFWERYKVEIKAQRIDAADEEEDNKSEEDESGDEKDDNDDAQDKMDEAGCH